MKRPASATCQDTSLGLSDEESAFTVGSVTPQRSSAQSSSWRAFGAHSSASSSVVCFTELISPALSQAPVEETVVGLAPVRRRLWGKRAVPLLAIEDKRPDEAIVELPSLPDGLDEEPFAPEDAEPFAPDGLDEDAAEADAIIRRRFVQRYRRWVQAKMDALDEDDVRGKNRVRFQHDLKRMTLEQRLDAAKAFFSERPAEEAFQRQVLELMEKRVAIKSTKEHSTLTPRRRS